MAIRKKYVPVVRDSSKDGRYFGSALVGANTVVLGWNLKNAQTRRGLLGFAVRRKEYDATSSTLLRTIWLNGQKRFNGSDNTDFDVRSDQAPFQRFRWSDYTVDSSRSYRYDIYPMRGDPGDLRRDDPITLQVRPSDYVVNGTGVFFNRGVTAAKAYFRRFQNQHPDTVPNGAAYEWLSRGLKESLLNFIGAATAGDTLHVAIYEFFFDDIAQALRAAHDKGVNVHIVYHAKAGDKATKESKHVLKSVGLHKKENSTARTNTSGISHNKFVVHVNSSGTPVRLWTASANFSNNAFHFQTNCALTFDDLTLARIYEEYFQILKRNLKARKLSGHANVKDEIINHAATFENALPPDISEILFSPVRKPHVVDTAKQLIGEARSAIFVSAPFGLSHNDFHDALQANTRGILEYGLSNATAINKIASLNHDNTRFFPPKKLKSYMGEKWDAKAFGAHKIHAKTLVVDPWSENPAVLIGSANFSRPSCTKNDENTLLIRNDKRLAAMISVEFIRMYEHYRSRFWIEEIAKRQSQNGRPRSNSSFFLTEDDSWSRTSFDPSVNSRKFRDRIVFSGEV